MRLSDLDPPNSYTISGEGTGGPVGLAKVGAKVRLEANGGVTLLRYDVNAQMLGKLAQIGSRLIEATAKKMADQFFSGFAAALAGPAPEEAAPEVRAPA